MLFDDWGNAQEVDIGDMIAIDYARVWAGFYTRCEGGGGPTVLMNPNGAPPPVCSMTHALTGANATLDHWSEAIGGSAAHEAGHTYGLAHMDDNPMPDPCSVAGHALAPGEGPYNKHLMPAGCNLTGSDRTTYRRHFSDRDYGLLATNVGLSIETVHSWTLVNPNAEAASSLAVDFLSPLASVTPARPYNGSQSPWLNPVVSGPSGTRVFQRYNLQQVSHHLVGRQPSMVELGAQRRRRGCRFSHRHGIFRGGFQPAGCEYHSERDLVRRPFASARAPTSPARL
jgi:hypothetical protein